MKAYRSAKPPYVVTWGPLSVVANGGEIQISIPRPDPRFNSDPGVLGHEGPVSTLTMLIQDSFSPCHFLIETL